MSNIFEVQTVIFDMDGVLLDSEPLWEESENEVLLQYGIDREYIFSKYNLVTTGMRINEVVQMFCQIVPEKKINPIEMADRIIDATIDKIIATKPILPGVRESLELCQELGFKIGLASSSAQRVIETVTDLFNITQYFSVRASAEKLSYGKPNPEVYLVAAEKLKTNPINCLTIEDSIAGMIAARAARMQSIVVPAIQSQSDPRWCLADYKLSSLLELSEVHLQKS